MKNRLTEIVYKKVGMVSKENMKEIKMKLLQNYIRCYFPESNFPITLTYNQYGKPDFQHYPLKFNVSHSGDYLVCAFSGKEIGVDIQKMKEVDLNIAKRFFTENEANYILFKPEKDRLNAFFRLWVLKESFIKAVGQGLSLPFNSFEITFHNGKPQVVCRSVDGNFSFSEYNVFEGYKMAVCIKEV